MENYYTEIILKSGKDQSLKRFHPWVFSDAVKQVNGQVVEGQVVVVKSNHGEFLGIGHYQIGSIAVRIFSFENVPIDNHFWTQKLQHAFDLRKVLLLPAALQTNVYRLVHGEGDGMPGLIIDYYNGTAVFQMHSIGMHCIREQLAACLKEVMGDELKAVYDKSSKTIPFKSDVEAHDGFIFGESLPGIVSEYGNRFKVDWEEGQKTGFFIDQRENRKLIQQYASGRDVLNMFCYTGGFSFYAMQGGANLVHSVDASEKAIALTNENVELNFPGDKRHKAYAADVFDFMKDIKNRYDLIVLDPPAFAKHQRSLPQALRGYKRINTRAFEQIRPGGILFTFSCSQVVSKDKFREAVFRQQPLLTGMFELFIS